MSPYIFIMCMELLSTYIHYQVDLLLWDPIQLSTQEPFFSHLFFFADDLTLITKGTSKSLQTISICMNDFYVLSSQKINHTKSKAIYSHYCEDNVQDLVKNLLSITLGKYLGLPILSEKPKPKDFQFIIDNMKKKLSNWKTQFMTIVGRVRLAKTTLNAISAYTMK